MGRRKSRSAQPRGTTFEQQAPRRPTKRKRSRRYRVKTRGERPIDLVMRISSVHAVAVADAARRDDG